MSSSTSHRQARDPSTGAYAFDGNFGRTCLCGHSLGEHLAGGFDCIAHDTVGAGGYSIPRCDCPHFIARRRASDLAAKRDAAAWAEVGRRMADAHRAAGAAVAASKGSVVAELRAAHPDAAPLAAYLVGEAYGRAWGEVDWMGETFLAMWRREIELRGADV